MTLHHSFRRAVYILFCIVCMPSALIAQNLNPEDLVDALTQKKTRGATGVVAREQEAERPLIETLKERVSRGLSVTKFERDSLAKSFVEYPAVDLEINFDFASFEIAEYSRPVVMALGRALRDPKLHGATFIVAGHTDRKGSAAYNQKLSEHRANAVRDFLMRTFDIPGDQLIPVGYGFEQLKYPKKPYAAENRRVQVLNATREVASGNSDAGLGHID